jgi:cyclopropane fatty-acyl-phospholipid synthase-like methyltransferase
VAAIGSGGIEPPELEERLRAWNGVYDSATSVIWQKGVYEPVHGGWRFSNIGGSTVLSFLGDIARLRPDSCALEVGSGLGDTSRYVAQRFGCTVVGVDMNASQVRHAREMARATTLEDRLLFVHANIEDQQTIATLRTVIPATGVDLIYTLDVLMLTANPGGVLRSAARLLCDGGWVALAEVTSGPVMSPQLRDHLRDTDGMQSLLTPTEYAALLHEAGLTEVRIIDRTPLAIACFQKMASAFARAGVDIIEAAGREQYEAWRSITDMYITCFCEGRLLYTQMLARQSISNRPMRPA